MSVVILYIMKHTYRKSRKHTKNNKNKTKRIHRLKHKKMQLVKGGCDCGSNLHVIKGGNLQASPYYYPLNDHIFDPLSPAAVSDARLLPNTYDYKPLPQNGGNRKSKSKSKKNRTRRMKGGFDVTGLFTTASFPFGPQLANPLLSIGSTSGAFVSANIINGHADITQPTVLHNREINPMV
jgi:hypothetical protein